jgi:hypothetical protein
VLERFGSDYHKFVSISQSFDRLHQLKLKLAIVEVRW